LHYGWIAIDKRLTYISLQNTTMNERDVTTICPPVESAQLPQIENETEIESASVNPPETQLFDLYEKIAKAHPGSRDAEIFERIHEWTFSDFTVPAHEFAQITKAELVSWQKRNRINLSAGHIRPEHIDIERGHAWGQIRMTNAVNRMHHVMMGPPSAEEIKLSWSKRDS
jgi:hypothetical protein